MARPLRIQFEGAVYHVLSRGNRGEYVFSDDENKDYFISLLERGVEKYGVELYAYCIMGNHYHLLLSTPEGDLSTFMHYLGSSCGSYLRRTQGWIGHVFAGRYKSLCVEKETYLLELSRYIHLNPVRAKIVELPEEYLWSSYRYYVGQLKSPGWLDAGWLLEEYGRRLKASQRRYKEFVELGISTTSNFPEEKIVGQAILGSEAFVNRIVSGMGKDKMLEEVTAKRIFLEKINVNELYKRICEHYKIKGFGNDGIRGSEIKHGREMFVYLAKEKTSALNKEISLMIGNLSPSGVTHQYKRTLRKLESDRVFVKKWRREADEIISIFNGWPESAGRPARCSE